MNVFEDVAQALLEAAPEGSFIAGGSVRDNLLGRPIKDIDLYVPRIPPKLSKLIGMPLIGFMSTDSDEYRHAYIHGRAKGELDGYEVDVILLKDGVDGPEDLFQTWTIGLCKVYMSLLVNAISKEVAGVMTTVTDEFEQDRNNKTITFTERGWGEEGCAKHLARVQAKYPDYLLVRKPYRPFGSEDFNF